MTTENLSSLVQLFKHVREYFAAHAPEYEVIFGARKRWQQLSQGTNGANRVVMVPGRVPGGEDGELGGVDGPGEDIDVSDVENGKGVAIPRGLYRQDKIVTFSLWAADQTNDPQTQDEAQQEQITEELFELVQRAVKHSFAGIAEHEWTSCRYNREPNELRHGVEYLAEMTLGTVYLDAVPRHIVPAAAAVERGAIS